MLVQEITPLYSSPPDYATRAEVRCAAALAFLLGIVIGLVITVFLKAG